MFIEKFKLKKLRPHYSIILHCLALICLYIEIATVFNQIRLPFFLLNNTYLNGFNKVIENISVGYLTGYIVFAITVLYKKKHDREANKWGIYDWCLRLNDVKSDIEITMGIDYKYINMDLYKQEFIETFSQKIEEELDKILSKGIIYEHLLNKNESDALGAILKYRKINCYFAEMSEKQAQTETRKIIELCRSIDSIYSSICSLIKNT